MNTIQNDYIIEMMRNVYRMHYVSFSNGTATNCNYTGNNASQNVVYWNFNHTNGSAIRILLPVVSDYVITNTINRVDYNAIIRTDNFQNWLDREELDCPACYGREGIVMPMKSIIDKFLYNSYECQWCGEEFSIETDITLRRSDKSYTVTWLD